MKNIHRSIIIRHLSEDGYKTVCEIRHAFRASKLSRGEFEDDGFLDVLFREFNRSDGNTLIDTFKIAMPSMSVGDEVTIREWDEESSITVTYRCATFGWAPHPKYKVQIAGVQGWYDLRSNSSDSEDDKYTPRIFDSIADANREMETPEDYILGKRQGPPYRVVPVSQPEDWTPYCDV